MLYLDINLYRASHMYAVRTYFYIMIKLIIICYDKILKVPTPTFQIEAVDCLR